jgi:hypothetical protein
VKWGREMKARFFSFIASLLMLGVVGTAQALPIDVTYTVSGSAGNWLYDFSVDNNLGGTNDIYMFGVQFSADHIVSSPTGWVDKASISPGSIPWNNASFGGSSRNYYNVWTTSGVFPAGAILAGAPTVSGFDVLDTSQTALPSVLWFAFAAGGTYTGGGTFNPNTNPGFEGTGSTPLPAALPLFASGLGVMGYLAKRRKRKAAALAA